MLEQHPLTPRLTELLPEPFFADYRPSKTPDTIDDEIGIMIWNGEGEHKETGITIQLADDGNCADVTFTDDISRRTLAKVRLDCGATEKHVANIICSTLSKEGLI
jgi:hypothetical protein